jgi:anti-anti-sigma regulatory factor
MIRSLIVLESGPLDGAPGWRPGVSGPALVRLAGPVDAVDRATLDRLLFDLAGVPDVRLDVSDVAFVGSVFADFLDRLEVSARRAGGRLRLCAPVPLHVSRLLVLAGIDDRFRASERSALLPSSFPSER